MKEVNKKQKKKDSIFLVMTGFSCNNNCIFCSNLSDRNLNKTTAEVKAEIRKGYQEGHEMLEFIGGEVTIRADFIELVSYAKKIGFKGIGLSSNGRLFSYPKFVQEAYQAGLNRIGISLYGHNKLIHQASTRTADSFDQSLAGIKNLAQIKDIALAVNTVITKINYKALPEMASFLQDLGIKEWRLIEMLPDGFAKDNYNLLAVKYREVALYIKKACLLGGKIKTIFIYDFPFCIFDKEIFSDSRIVFFTPRDRCEKVDQQGYGDAQALRATKTIKGDKILYQDKYRIKLASCQKCPHFYYCGGITKPYLELFKGEKEIFDKQKVIDYVRKEAK